MAFFTSSILSTPPATAWTEHPIAFSSWKSCLLCSDIPALRERKVKCLAPDSTSHIASERPNPPRPPARRYVAVPSKLMRRGDNEDGMDEVSSGMLNTTFPIWVPCCRYRKAWPESSPLNVVMGVIGCRPSFMRPLSLVSILLHVSWTF